METIQLDGSIAYENVLKELSKYHFLVLGSLALSFHTIDEIPIDDLDIYPKQDEDNLEGLFSTLESIKFYFVEEHKDRIDRFSFVDDTGFKVDVFLYTPISFEEMFDRKVTVITPRVKIYIPSIEDLLVLKQDQVKNYSRDYKDLIKVENAFKLWKR